MKPEVNALEIDGLPDPDSSNYDWHYSEWVRQLVQIGMEAKSMRDSVPHHQRFVRGTEAHRKWHQADGIFSGVGDCLINMDIKVFGLNVTVQDIKKMVEEVP